MTIQTRCTIHHLDYEYEFNLSEMDKLKCPECIKSTEPMKSKPKSEEKKKELTKYLCAWCGGNTFYREFDHDWHGLNVVKDVCTECGCVCAVDQVTKVAWLNEKDMIEFELKKKNDN